MKVKQLKADQRKKKRCIPRTIPKAETTRQETELMNQPDPPRTPWANRRQHLADYLRSRGDIDAAKRVESKTDSEISDDFVNELSEQMVLHKLGIDIELIQRSAAIDSRSRLLTEDYDGKVASLSGKETMLFDATSETVPMRAVALALKAKVPDEDNSGNVKACLSVLCKKLGLLRHAKGGYLRNPRPQ